MASATETTKRPTDVGKAERTEQRFVDEQIRRTRRALKSVDLVAGCITLVIGILSYLLTMAVLEHWVVPGGLSPTARAMLLIVLVGGVLWYSWRCFWPLISQPINPVYAAHTIEQGSPTLKNSLLNLLLLRSRRRQISRQVYEAIETQAAQRLSQSSVDSAVDRSSILRLGYVLVAVVALCTLYRILSPKDPLASAGRLLMPWANIAVPSRVQIIDVEPGDTSAARGEQLTISAEILGKSQEEPVRLVYSQVDGQISNREVLMTGDEAGLRFSAKVPGRIALGSSGGIQGDLVYHIEAGDARSPDFHVSVFSQPTLVVERIRYEYPLYTRYPPREEAFVGDISGLEGTVVTLYAVANQPIAQAHVDFEADGRHDLLMNSDKLSSSVRFPLEFKEDRRTQKHQSYVLRYTTDEGRKNPSPPKYRIHVERDYSPEVELTQPVEELLEVGLNDEVVLEVEARDPDFALHNVAVLGEVAGERVMKESLLSADHTGRFAGSLKIVPADLRLREGDILEYWAAAADNRRPEPNLAFSTHKKLRIVGPGQRDRLPDNEQENQPGEGPGENGDQGEGGEQGEGQEGQGQQGQSGGGENQQGGEGQQQQGEGGPGQQNGESGEGQQQGQGQQGQSGQQQQSGEGEGESQGENDGQSQDDGAAGGQERSESGSNDSQGQPSAENDRVSPDGDNDSEAFDRIAKHLEEQQQEGQNSEGSESGTSDGQEQPGENQQSQGEQSEGAGTEKQGEQSAGEAAEQDSGEQQGEGGSEQSAEGEAEGQGEAEGEEGAQGQQQSEGEGAQGEASAEQQQEGEQQGGEQQEGQQEQGDQEGNSPDAEMSQEQGDAGAGDNPGENEGAPNPDGTQKPSDKDTQSGAEAPTNDEEASAESQSKKESDSEGSQGGDRSGGGQEGAGQQADEEGTGTSGENQSAEDGGGQSSETGEGETGDQAGGEQSADGETGESSGDQPGEGSQQGDQAGTKPGEGESESASQPGEKPGDPAETSGGTPEGGGTGSNNTAPPPSGGELEPADDANLEYARKQTDLVLNTLDEQLRKKQVDEKLLEKLGWTTDELQRFVNRWKNLKDKANAGGPNAKQAQAELDTALQTLGLNPKRRTGFNSRNAKDELRNLNESFRGRTPLEYQELMRKYVKGTAGAEDEE